ncbi:MAG: hypothetical protein AAFV93_19370, partial [Chloroflexota bacterium]
MPGWYNATQDPVQQNQLTHVGLVIEQHPERTQLFMQWKQMNWSFMVDPFNLLNMRFVPCTIAIDEHGIIQAVQPRLDRAEEFIELFVNQTFDAPQNPPPAQKFITQAEKPTIQSAQVLSDYAVALALWDDETRLDEAITVSQQALAIQEDDRTHFNLGVIYRMRYDSVYRQDDDFSNAIHHWTQALNYDPNNYIWRRRIQQYGPRLDKPYPFYDWIPTAREAIIARGETPHSLSIEPRGAEFAEPIQIFDSQSTQNNPDPDNRIYQDTEPLIDADIVVVPPQIVAGESVRVHITLRPNDEAHWNNEVDDTVLWVNQTEGWQADQAHHHTVPNGAGATSDETRQFELELRSSSELVTGQHSITAYSLYYICEDVNGICLYRRQ